MTGPTDVGAEERGFYSVSEVAALLGVSRVSIWRWISAGRLPVSRLGHRTVRIRREDVDRIARPLRGRRSQTAVLLGDSVSAVALQPGSKDHLVMFYDAEPFLIDSVAEFLAPALKSGDRAAIVATPRHRAEVEERLLAAGVDVLTARHQARYVIKDAGTTLSRFMVAGWPDPARFEAVVRELTAETGHGREMRIYGEMVALLVAQGNARAALMLESLWNQVQPKYPFSILCAYPMRDFHGNAHTELMADACAQHSSVIPTERFSTLAERDDRLRAVAALQQKAASLEIEVAERRKVEEQLQRALAAERAARDEAEAALRLRDEFLSIASHELRTPITVVSAQAQLILRRLERTGEFDAERVVHALRSVGSQADKLARLVGQLLDVSRIDSGRLQLDPSRTDLAQLVQRAVSASQSLTDEHHISLTAPKSLDCRVDPLRLEQVLTNLLDNAIKYSPGGGAVEVVLGQPTPNWIELSIRDHGIGIAPDKREHIFERFYQAHEESGIRGMGLGLYVSRQIVELHGGQIATEFPEDGGTRFVVRLPLSAPSLQAATAAD
jgi:excisionase family DNA binding protein